MTYKNHVEDNNKFLKSCDIIKPTSFIIYLDANDLYGHSMMQFSQLKCLTGLRF